MVPDTPLTQKYFPVPLNQISTRSSNSLVEWFQLLSIPSRRADNLTEILDNLKGSPIFQDLKKQLNFPEPNPYQSNTGLNYSNSKYDEDNHEALNLNQSGNLVI